jgi:hypothetical protein
VYFQVEGRLGVFLRTDDFSRPVESNDRIRVELPVLNECVMKLENYTRNEWERCKLHSKRVEKRRKLHSKRVEKMRSDQVLVPRVFLHVSVQRHKKSVFFSEKEIGRTD